jgi:hypothetical protein
MSIVAIRLRGRPKGWPVSKVAQHLGPHLERKEARRSVASEAIPVKKSWAEELAVGSESPCLAGNAVLGSRLARGKRGDKIALNPRKTETTKEL